MPYHPVTLTEFILEEENHVKDATGKFTLLLTHIENAAKIIASHVKKTGLVDIIGNVGETNAFQEEVQKLDKYSNELLIRLLTNSALVSVIGSEELPEPIVGDSGDYIVFFDPLDGSSNVDTGIGIGTIFSIYHKNKTILQQGMKQVAAGYILYGSSVMFVYSCGHGVNGFTLDPSIGSFLLSHPDIRIPEKGAVYSMNEGYTNLYDTTIIRYLNTIKAGDKPYKLRYAGSMVADVHRTLLKGGIFLYPADKKNPHGKLRLLYEVNPMSYLVQQAGGKALSGTESPLLIIPTSYTQRVPIVLGSKAEVELFKKITTG